MRLVRTRHSGLAQALGVVIAWRSGRDSPGLADAAGVLGMGDAGSRDAMTIVIVALAAEVVSACPVIAGRLAGMIGGQSLAVAIAGRVAGVIRTATTAANTSAMTATVATAVSAAVTTAITAAATATATATAVTTATFLRSC